MKEKEETKEKPRCSKCNSTLVHYRIKDKKRVCRQCGFTEELK